MIKLGTSPHPKSDREMYEDYFIFFSKSTFKSPHQTPKKQSTNTQQSLNEFPTNNEHQSNSKNLTQYF